MDRADPTPVDEFLAYLVEAGGSDLLLTAGAPPWVRVDGELLPMEGAKPLTPEEIETFADKMFTKALAKVFLEHKQVDFSFNWRGKARIRANAFRQRGSAGLAFRLIPYHIPTFDELGLPGIIDEIVQRPQGLVLVTGPTGSGKSTTLAAMIDWINQHRRCHILTIEDPIEYVHRHNLAAVNQREVGEDAPSFALALRAALREDPDVLLVGEMRDLESIQTVLTIAETGHLVFATLHTNDTSQAIDRIVDVFPGIRQEQIRIQLANSLTAVLHQRLLPRIDGGRVAAFEVLLGVPPVRNLVREGKTRQLRNIVATGQRDGMCTLESSLSRLVSEGIVDHESATKASVYTEEVLTKMQSAAQPGRTGQAAARDQLTAKRARRG